MLQLVGDSGAFEGVDAPGSAPSPPPNATIRVRRHVLRSPGSRPVLLALIASAFGLLVFAAVAHVTARNEEASRSAPVSTTTTLAAVVPAPVAKRSAAPAAEIPVVDVKSLPAAPPPRRVRSSR